MRNIPIEEAEGRLTEVIEPLAPGEELVLDT